MHLFVCSLSLSLANFLMLICKCTENLGTDDNCAQLKCGKKLERERERANAFSLPLSLADILMFISGCTENEGKVDDYAKFKRGQTFARGMRETMHYLSLSCKFLGLTCICTENGGKGDGCVQLMCGRNVDRE